MTNKGTFMGNSKRVKNITRSILSGESKNDTKILSVKTADIDGVKELSYKVMMGCDLHQIVIQKVNFLCLPLFVVAIKSASGNVFEECFVSLTIGFDFNRQYRGILSGLNRASKHLRKFRLQKLKLS
jgi:hypothetical protein